MPCQCHLAPPIGPQRGVAGRPLVCPMLERGVKLALAKGSKQQREAFASGCRASPVKNASWAPRPGLLVVDQGVLPAGAEQGIDRRPRLASSLLQRKREGTAVWRLPLCSLGVWEPSLGMGPQGPFSLQNDLPASTSQPGLTISPQAAGDAIFLKGRRAAPESGFPGLCHTASVWLLRHQTSGPAPRASIPKSGPGVCLHSASLANTFLGQRDPANGEGGWGNASEGAGFHARVTWPRVPGTSHGPPARGGGPAPGMPDGGAGSKTRSGRRKQTATGGLCKQLLGRPPLGLPRRKMPVVPLGPVSRWAPRAFCPQEPSTVQTCLGLQARSCRANVVEKPCGSCLDVPWECGSPPWPQGHKGHCHCKVTSPKALPRQG